MIDVRAAWERYRAACFIRSGVDTVWWWAADHLFDFPRVALHLLDVDGSGINAGSHAMALMAWNEIHLVPLARLTPSSIDHLQSHVSFDLARRLAEIRREQLRIEDELEVMVRVRYAARLADPDVALRSVN